MKKFIIVIKENEKCVGIWKTIFSTKERAEGYIQCLEVYKKKLNFNNYIFEIVEVDEAK